MYHETNLYIRKMCKKWDEILAQLKQLSTIKIERFVAFTDTVEQYKLFVFCDASMNLKRQQFIFK